MVRVAAVRHRSFIPALVLLLCSVALVDIARAQTADLSVTKTDNQTSAVPGTLVTYVITVSNAGPDPVTGASVTDAFPLTLSGVTWACVASMGSCAASGSGDITDAVDLLAGGTATYTVMATIAPSATGTLDNMATVAAPLGVTDLDPSNDSAIDSDTLTPQADLGITKTDGASDAIPGMPITYTITVTNSGPSDAPVALVSDSFPATLTGVTWTCSASGGASCSPSGSTVIADSANLPVGSVVTYTAQATIDPAALGTLTNMASVSPGAGVTDLNSANDTATDSDTLTPVVDLSLSKTDGVTAAVPGTSVTYTVTVTNSGPSVATDATVTDMFPAAISGATWTCTAGAGSSCPASGSGDINAMVTVAVAGSLTFQILAPITPCATGPLTNTASVTPPGGTTDTNLADNSATDTDSLTPIANLSVTVDDSVSLWRPPSLLTYTVTITNLGPSCATGVTLVDTQPVETTFVSSTPTTPTCTQAANVTTCALGSLAALATTTVTIVVDITTPTPGATITNTATVTANETDPDLTNNTASVGTQIDTKSPYVLVLLGSPKNLRVGTVTTVVYKMKLRSLYRPSVVTDVTLSNVLPPSLMLGSATPPPTTQDGNTLNWVYPSLQGGDSRQVIIKATLAPGAAPGACLVDTATVVDTLGNRGEESISGTLRPQPVPARIPPDLRVSLTTSPTVLIGGKLKSTIAVVNSGRGDVQNVTLTVEAPSALQFVSALPPPAVVETVDDMTRLVWLFANVRAPGQARVRLTQAAGPGASPCNALKMTATVTAPSGQQDQESKDIVIRE